MGCFNLNSHAQQVIKKVEADGIETVRAVFVDQHGILRGKTIVSSALQTAFNDGIRVPSTLLLKDTSHRTVFPIWSNNSNLEDLPLHGASDVVLRPNPERFHPIPWSPHSAFLLCSIEDQNGKPIFFSSDEVLSIAVNALKKAGYRAVFGLEVEFQIFCVIDQSLSHAQATMPPAPVKTENLIQGHQYLTAIRYAEVEETLDELRRMSELLGLEPRSVEIEMGPSQFEFTFNAADPQTQADRFVLFRTLVKEVCHRRGLHASFMPKPALQNAAANGWHLHQSLLKIDGTSVFTPQNAQTLTDEVSGWIAGILEHAKSCCLLTNPTVNSYKRFIPYQLAPNRIQWGRDNRGAMLRALLKPSDHTSRLENRVADTSANPFYAIASQIISGLDGLQRGSKPPEATEKPYEGASSLPRNLLEAIEAFEESPLMASYYGTGFQKYLGTLKRAEWERYLMTVSEWEQQEYFGLF